MSVRMHYHIIGQNIRSCRLRLHLTQEELAERAGICQQFLSNLERGRSIPSLETVMSLCDAMDVDSNELLTHSAVHDDCVASHLKSEGLLSGMDFAENMPRLIVIKPEDLPLLDLDLLDDESCFSEYESDSSTSFR